MFGLSRRDATYKIAVAYIPYSGSEACSLGRVVLALEAMAVKLGFICQRTVMRHSGLYCRLELEAVNELCEGSLPDHGPAHFVSDNACFERRHDSMLRRSWTDKQSRQYDHVAIACAEKSTSGEDSLGSCPFTSVHVLQDTQGRNDTNISFSKQMCNLLGQCIQREDWSRNVGTKNEPQALLREKVANLMQVPLPDENVALAAATEGMFVRIARRSKTRLARKQDSATADC